MPYEWYFEHTMLVLNIRFSIGDEHDAPLIQINIHSDVIPGATYLDTEVPKLGVLRVARAVPLEWAMAA